MTLFMPIRLVTYVLLYSKLGFFLVGFTDCCDIILKMYLIGLIFEQDLNVYQRSFFFQQY